MHKDEHVEKVRATYQSELERALLNVVARCIINEQTKDEILKEIDTFKNDQ